MTRKINKLLFLDKHASFRSDGVSVVGYAKYKDGCYSITYSDGTTEWTGKNHAPHPNFVPNDVPVEEWHS